MPELLFLLKKVVSAFLMPLPFGGLLLLLVGVLFLVKRKIAAKAVLIAVLMFWYMLSIAATEDWLAGSLEYQYPKYENQTVNFVLVLGGYHRSDEKIPLSSLLSKTSLMRLMEGLQIHKLNPDSKLLLSGSGGRDEISNAYAMKLVANSLGVPDKDIILAERVKDTTEEAAHWVKVVQSRPFALVTSAMHMRRSVYLFEQAFKQQILLEAPQYDQLLVPAPTAFSGPGKQSLFWRSWVPNAKSLSNVEAAWHEYLGLAWAKLHSD